MSFFDFFFPEQAQASHLRSIADRSRLEQRRSRSTAASSASNTAALTKRVEDLESDLGFVSLLLGSVMAQLDERGHISRDDLKELIKEVDGADGVEDGRLDVGVLRGLSQ